MKQSDLYDIVTKLVAEMDESHRAQLLSTLSTQNRPVAELTERLKYAKLAKVGELCVWKVATTFNGLLNDLDKYHHAFFILPPVKVCIKKMQRPNFMEVGELYDTWNTFVDELDELSRLVRPS